MSRLIQYEMVCVRKLLFPESDYDGWRLNKRKPRIGDTGTLIDILETKDLPPRYVVESSGKDGITVFLSEFTAEEIEPIGNEKQPAEQSSRANDHTCHESC